MLPCPWLSPDVLGVITLDSNVALGMLAGNRAHWMRQIVLVVSSGLKLGLVCAIGCA